MEEKESKPEAKVVPIQPNSNVAANRVDVIGDIMINIGQKGS